MNAETIGSLKKMNIISQKTMNAKSEFTVKGEHITQNDRTR